MQKDLQVLADSSSSLHSWLSEEVASTRRALREELAIVTEEQFKEARAEVGELRALVAAQGKAFEDMHTVLSGQLSQCQTSLDAHAEELRFLGRASLESGKPNSAAEARALAEERRWRLKLDAWQESLDRQRGAVEALERLGGNLSDRLAEHDSEFRKSAVAVQRLESQCGEMRAEVKAAQATVDRQRSAASTWEARCSDLERRLSTAESRVALCDGLASKADGQLAAFVAEQRRVWGQHESRSERTDVALEALKLDIQRQVEQLTQGLDRVGSLESAFAGSEAKLLTAECERLAELRVVCENVEAQGLSAKEQLEVLSARTSSLEEGLSATVGLLRSEWDARLDKKASKESLEECSERIGELSQQLTDLVAGEDRIAGKMMDLAKLVEVLDMRDARFDALQKELRWGLAQKANAADLKQATETLHSWVEEVREALGSWSKQAQQRLLAELEASKVSIRRHESMLGNVWDWCQQVRVREQGLAHVLLHVIEGSTPEQIRSLEKFLMMPNLDEKDRGTR